MRLVSVVVVKLVTKEVAFAVKSVKVTAPKGEPALTSE